ncbi:MAG: HD domain-containing protein [Gemmatimonadetes bacterium]|nr:HD domain-containing protein [Gemmatimonadota bacterium]
MSRSTDRTVRDPLWQNVHLDAAAASVVDTPEFQRLRRVKQLGFAHLVYPGAVHNRFLHALGVYHLTGRAIEALGRKGDLERLDDLSRKTIPEIKLAALLHDVGHYAFSHAMEELEPDSIPGHHEEVADQFLDSPGIRAALGGQGAGAVQRIGDLIRGRSKHPLQGLVSGSLDLDKIDYLRRDSLFCGVPYGAVDVDRLLDSLTLARESESGSLEVAVTEKGISALESLMLAKYQMFRNVYWHHAVRSATVAFRRLVEGSLETGLLLREDLAGPTDEELLNLLAARMESGGTPPILGTLLMALVDRRLPKRTIELLGDELPEGIADWLPHRRDLVRRVEDRLAAERGLEPGAVFLDYPSNPRMLELRLLLVRRRGEVIRLTSEGEAGLIDLPRLGRSLHHTTRVLRVFCLEADARWDPEPLLELLASPEDDVERRLESGEPIYSD